MNESVNRTVLRETKIQSVLALKSSVGDVLTQTAHTGRFHPKRGTIFRLHVYKRVGISPVEVMKREGNLSEKS